MDEGTEEIDAWEEVVQITAKSEGMADMIQANAVVHLGTFGKSYKSKFYSQFKKAGYLSVREK